MEPAAAVLPVEIDSPAAEIQDFDAVVRLYWPRIFRFVLASLRDRDAAETLTQDCFVRAYRARQWFRGECGVHTWLVQIAINLVRDHTRSARFRFWKQSRAVDAD